MSVTADLKRAKELSKRLAAIGAAPVRKTVSKKPKSLDFLNNLTGLSIPKKRYQRPKKVYKSIATPFDYSTKLAESVSSTQRIRAIVEEAVARALPKAELPDMESVIAPLVAKTLSELPKSDFVVTEEVARQVVQMMHSLPEKDKLEVSKGIRNAQSFIFNKTKYKMEEMMHGGSPTGGSAFTVLPPTGTINSANTVFTFTQVPSYIVSDGVWFPPTSANGTVFWTHVGTTVTMVNPPTFDIYGIA